MDYVWYSRNSCRCLFALQCPVAKVVRNIEISRTIRDRLLQNKGLHPPARGEPQQAEVLDEAKGTLSEDGKKLIINYYPTNYRLYH